MNFEKSELRLERQHWLPTLTMTMTRSTVPPGGTNINPVDKGGLCLLSLDGGGVRGLSTLHILKRIMNEINRLRKEKGRPERKPCEVFDLIGGTSTGG